MKPLKKDLMARIAVCAVFLLLSTGVIQQIPVVSPITVSDPIIAYGSEAQTFASMLSTEIDINSARSSQQSVIVLSDIETADLQSISDSMKNGAILVAINLPVDNGVVSVPTVEENVTVSQTSLDNSARSTENIVSQSFREIVPPFWIVIIQQTTPGRTESYMTLNDDEESREDIMQIALEAVTSPSVASSSRGSTGEGHWVHIDTVRRYMKYGTGQANFYDARHEIYQLDIWDEPTEMEYWQVETTTDSYIGTYESTPGHCGPYMNLRQTSIWSNGEVYRYGPTSTQVSGITEISISFGVTNNGASIAIGYSQSWNTPGVIFKDSGDENWIIWKESFQGMTNALLWPWYTPPCNPSHDRYASTTRVVYEVPLSSGGYWHRATFDLGDYFVLHDYTVIPGTGGLYNAVYDYNFPSVPYSYLSMFD